mmetsp:Transcript_31539/g.49269  ORF Transcript_31539/g.49269 Transcript_31539/m.49269 type:complete len:256 (-) Transcript_31539:646-1413(-)
MKFLLLLQKVQDNCMMMKNHMKYKKCGLCWEMLLERKKKFPLTVFNSQHQKRKLPSQLPHHQHQRREHIIVLLLLVPLRLRFLPNLLHNLLLSPLLNPLPPLNLLLNQPQALPPFQLPNLPPDRLQYRSLRVPKRPKSRPLRVMPHPLQPEDQDPLLSHLLLAHLNLLPLLNLLLLMVLPLSPPQPALQNLSLLLLKERDPLSPLLAHPQVLLLLNLDLLPSQPPPLLVSLLLLLRHQLVPLILVHPPLALLLKG